MTNLAKKRKVWRRSGRIGVLWKCSFVWRDIRKGYINGGLKPSMVDGGGSEGSW